MAPAILSRQPPPVSIITTHRTQPYHSTHVRSLACTRHARPAHVNATVPPPRKLDRNEQLIDRPATERPQTYTADRKPKQFGWTHQSRRLREARNSTDWSRCIQSSPPQRASLCLLPYVWVRIRRAPAHAPAPAWIIYGVTVACGVLTDGSIGMLDWRRWHRWHRLTLVSSCRRSDELGMPSCASCRRYTGAELLAINHLAIVGHRPPRLNHLGPCPNFRDTAYKTDYGQAAVPAGTCEECSCNRKCKCRDLRRRRRSRRSQAKPGIASTCQRAPSHGTGKGSHLAPNQLAQRLQHCGFRLADHGVV